MTIRAIACTLVLLFSSRLINADQTRNVKNMYHAVTQDALMLSVKPGPDTCVLNLASCADLSVEELSKPLNGLTKESLGHYLKCVYNNPKYASDVLIFQPFVHFTQFFEHGIATQQSRVYARAILRLFEHKFADVPSIDAVAFEQFMRRLPAMFESFLRRDTNRQAAAVKKATNYIYEEILHNADKLDSEPDVILENIARHLIDYKKLNRSTQSVGKSELRHAVINFIKLCTSKLVWQPAPESWDNFVTLANQFYAIRNTCLAARLDDVDDCLWALVSRFKFVLAISGAQFSPEFFEKARTSMTEGIEAFDAISEQEEFIRSKVLTLQDALIDAAARAQAQGKLGIVTDDIALVKPLPVESSVKEVHADTKTFTADIQEIRANTDERTNPKPEPYFIKQDDAQTW